MKPFDLAIEGGRIVRETGEFVGTIGISNGKIVCISAEAVPAHRTIAAHDHVVLPGGVDMHVHVKAIGDPNMAPICEDLPQASEAAIRGGVTSLGVYARAVPGVSLEDAIDNTISEGQSRSRCDFTINVIILPIESVSSQVVAARSRGVAHFKGMMAYANRGLMLSDGQLYELMRSVASVRGTALIHAENGGVTEELEKEWRKRDMVPHSAFLESSPASLEAEGFARAIAIARMTPVSRVIFVHVTSQMALETYSRSVPPQERRRFLIESQPHYLSMTNDAVLTRGALAKVGPPLKTADDTAAIRRGIHEGLIHHLSSDHSPRTKREKLNGRSILDAPYGGINGTGVLYRFAITLAVEEGLPLSDAVRLASTNPAKAYGIYPRKGEISPGSDADLALFALPLRPQVVRHSDLTTQSDYAFYDGAVLTSEPDYVVKGGEVVVDRQQLLGLSGSSRYIPVQDANV